VPPTPGDQLTRGWAYSRERAVAFNLRRLEAAAAGAGASRGGAGTSAKQACAEAPGGTYARTMAYRHLKSYVELTAGSIVVGFGLIAFGVLDGLDGAKAPRVRHHTRVRGVGLVLVGGVLLGGSFLLMNSGGLLLADAVAFFVGHLLIHSGGDLLINDDDNDNDGNDVWSDARISCS